MSGEELPPGCMAKPHDKDFVFVDAIVDQVWMGICGETPDIRAASCMPGVRSLLQERHESKDTIPNVYRSLR